MFGLCLASYQNVCYPSSQHVYDVLLDSRETEGTTTCGSSVAESLKCCHYQ